MRGIVPCQPSTLVPSILRVEPRLPCSLPGSHRLLSSRRAWRCALGWQPTGPAGAFQELLSEVPRAAGELRHACASLGLEKRSPVFHGGRGGSLQVLPRGPRVSGSHAPFLGVPFMCRSCFLVPDAPWSHWSVPHLCSLSHL